MKLVEAATSADAWLNATRYLLEPPVRCAHNLIVDIARPCDHDYALASALDDAIGAVEGGRVLDVARTILPASVLRARSWEQYATRLRGRWPRGGPSVRRTYFARMTDFRGDGRVNQVSGVITSLRNRRVDPDPIVFIRPGHSAPQHRSFPCLSQVQFHHDRVSGALAATAVYRSQYYDSKALGNFIGLGRLLGLVARESELKVGSLTVVATEARVGGAVSGLRQLVAEVNR